MYFVVFSAGGWWGAFFLCAWCWWGGSPDKQLLGVGDLNGNVKLFNCPCIEKDAPRVQQVAHVKEVAQVRFSCDGKYIVSVGKKDRSVITWKVKSDKFKK